MAIPSAVKDLMKLAGGEDWHWAAAVVERESDFNEYAVGDGGDALGLFQMHQDFLSWMYPEIAQTAGALIAMHGSPFAQAIAFKRFWTRFRHLDIQRRLEIYHYGLAATERRYESGDDTDPDGTVERYMENHAHYADGGPEFERRGRSNNRAIAAAADKARQRVTPEQLAAGDKARRKVTPEQLAAADKAKTSK